MLRMLLLIESIIDVYYIIKVDYSGKLYISKCY
jgi:hypothetical protein